jgi:hypothetical protein
MVLVGKLKKAAASQDLRLLCNNIGGLVWARTASMISVVAII